LFMAKLASSTAIWPLMQPGAVFTEPALALPGSVRHHEPGVIRRTCRNPAGSAAERLGISERTLRCWLHAFAAVAHLAMVQ
jgi:hypothetical protein